MKSAKKSKKLSNLELSLFCNQMSLILGSGISSFEGISIMIEDSQTDKEKLLLNEILSGLTESGSLSSSLKVTGLFPEYMTNMLKIGEETGKIDEVTAALSLHYQREHNISKAIRNAVTYPLIMVTMMLLVVLVLIIKVMPIFNSVFQQLGQELRGFSLAVMNLGEVISNYSLVFVAAIIMIAGLLIFLFKTKKGKALLLNICYKIPFTRIFYSEISSCRFAGGMAMTLSSGLTAKDGLELVHNLTDNPKFKEQITECQKAIDKGDELNAALVKSKIFTGNYARMASIGDKTGTLDEVMKKIAAQYEDSIDTRLSHIISIIEPSLVIFLSLIVGIILLSVMLPLLGVLTSL